MAVSTQAQWALPPRSAQADEAPRAITFQADIYPRVLSLLPSRRGGVLLDLGAGEGYFCRLASGRGWRVEACDYDRANFRAREARFHDADLNAPIPLDDDAYDCVVSIETIEHLENHFVFVSEALRVLRPGGTLIITTPNVVSLTSRLHYCLYGFDDCSPLPLDPHRPDQHNQHINPIGLPRLLYLVERFGGVVTGVETNRLRRSSFPLALALPLLAALQHRRLFRAKYREHADLFRRRLRWHHSLAALLGRISIVVARKSPNVTTPS